MMRVGNTACCSVPVTAVGVLLASPLSASTGVSAWSGPAGVGEVWPATLATVVAPATGFASVWPAVGDAEGATAEIDKFVATESVVDIIAGVWIIGGAAGDWPAGGIGIGVGSGYRPL